jgi:hypothetical protein
MGRLPSYGQPLRSCVSPAMTRAKGVAPAMVLNTTARDVLFLLF